MTGFAEYDGVRLLVDTYALSGVRKGSIGVILKAYDGGAFYEVEFSNPKTGEMLLVQSFPEEELEPIKTNHKRR